MAFSNKDIFNLINKRGWYYVLTAVDVDQVPDSSTAEALDDAQTAFSVLINYIPGVRDDDSGMYADDFREEEFEPPWIVKEEEDEFELDASSSEEEEEQEY